MITCSVGSAPRPHGAASAGRRSRPSASCRGVGPRMVRPASRAPRSAGGRRRRAGRSPRAGSEASTGRWAAPAPTRPERLEGARRHHGVLGGHVRRRGTPARAGWSGRRAAAGGVVHQVDGRRWPAAWRWWRPGAGRGGRVVERLAAPAAAQAVGDLLADEGPGRAERRLGLGHLGLHDRPLGQGPRALGRPLGPGQLDELVVGPPGQAQRDRAHARGPGRRGTGTGTGARRRTGRPAWGWAQRPSGTKTSSTW